MKPIKLFRSIGIDKIKSEEVYLTTSEQEKPVEILRLEGWAYKAKTSDGQYIIDSDSENIDTNNIELKRFYQNTMPLLFSHDQTQIAGKITGVRKEPEGLKIVAELYNFPDDALSSYVVPRVKSGLISAFSIGVLVKDFDVIEQNGEEYLQIKESEAFEVSLVSVPANSSALFNIVGGSETASKSLCVSKSALKAENPTICSDLESCGVHMKTKAIKNNKISTKPWGEVDKTALAHKVHDMGINYIKEAYLYVGDPEKVSTYKLPHHEVINGDLVVNEKGVQAAYAAIEGAHGRKPDLSAEELAAAKKHLRKHYKELVAQGLIDSIPEGLKSVKGEAVKTKDVGEPAEEPVEEPEVAEGEAEEAPVVAEGKTAEAPVEEPKVDEGQTEEALEAPDEGSVEGQEEPSDDSNEEIVEPELELKLSLATLEKVDINSIDEDELEEIYEVVASVSEKIEARVVAQLRELSSELLSE